VETTAAQVFLGILTIVGAVILVATCIIAQTVCCVAHRSAQRVSAALRQRFLKQDSVFLSVLVYSGCSAFRFPSARSD
jgi:ABC-type protease/lipase transport system fused ATPase/permease subunit